MPADPAIPRLGATEEIRQGELGGRVHRKKGVGDVLEATTGLERRGRRTSDDDPAELELRRESDLGESAEHERHHVGFAGHGAGRGDAFGRVIEEDLIAHDREAMLEREATEHVAIATADERAGRVGRMIQRTARV